MPNTKEVEQAAEKYAENKSSSEAFRQAHIADFIAGVEYALSNPLEQSEPFGYVFEGKFYKEVPERTFFEGNEPVAVYLSREQ